MALFSVTQSASSGIDPCLSTQLISGGALPPVASFDSRVVAASSRGCRGAGLPRRRATACGAVLPVPNHAYGLKPNVLPACLPIDPGIHVLPAPALLSAVTPTAGDRAVIAAVLHDVVEDTSMTLAVLAGEGFSPSNIAAVEALTKRPEGQMEAAACAAANPTARVVKLAGNAENMGLSHR